MAAVERSQQVQLEILFGNGNAGLEMGDRIVAGDGEDLVKGGPGVDDLQGQGDDDVCEGGPTAGDTFASCEVCGDPDGDCGP